MAPPETRANTTHAAEIAAIVQSQTHITNTLTEMSTRTLAVEEMVRSRTLVNERTAVSLERILGLLEKLHEDRTTERRAEKQPMKSPSSPMNMTPKSESEPLTTCLDVTVESVESASTEMELASIDVKDKSDLAIATGVFEDDDLDVSTIDLTQTEVTSDLFSADFSSVFVSSNAIIGEESFETKFCVSNTVSDLCLLRVCGNASVNFPSFRVTHKAFNPNWYSFQPFHIASMHLNPPWKPPDNRTISYLTTDKSYTYWKLPTNVFLVDFSLDSGLQNTEIVEGTDGYKFVVPACVQSRHTNFCSSGVCQNVNETFHSCSIMQCGLNACQCILFDWKYVQVQLMLAWYMRLTDFSIVMRIGENDQVVHIWELLTWTFQRTTWLGKESCISQIYSHLPHMRIVWNGILRILCWFGRLEELVQWYLGRINLIIVLRSKEHFHCDVPNKQWPYISYQMMEQFNQELSLTGKIPSGLFNSMFEFSGSWQTDAANTQNLAFDGVFITLYTVALDKSHIVLRDHVRKDVPASWDSAALARFIEMYGTHIIVGLKMGGKDVIYLKQQHSSTLKSVELQQRLKDMADKRFADNVGQYIMESEQAGQDNKFEIRMQRIRFVVISPSSSYSHKEDIVRLHKRRGGNDYKNLPHNAWLHAVQDQPDVISMSFIPITSLTNGAPGSGFLSHAINLYLRYKPPINEPVPSHNEFYQQQVGDSVNLSIEKQRANEWMSFKVGPHLNIAFEVWKRAACYLHSPGLEWLTAEPARKGGLIKTSDTCVAVKQEMRQPTSTDDTNLLWPLQMIQQIMS